MLYPLIKKFLFQLDPETSHSFALNSLDIAHKLGVLRLLPKSPLSPINLMGINFPNRVGLAAGLDKNADYVDALAALGFGFIEIGTVTPKPQAGNAKPRLFRLTTEEAIINRMGFNNKGVEYVARQLEKIRYRGILGINIGKNKDTPLENAVDDYLFGFRHLYQYASYMVINISSPNTPGLRNLQHGETLVHLLSVLKQEQMSIAQLQKKYVPLVVKISPDMLETEIDELAEILLQQKIDGVIATNTTVHREGVEHSVHRNEMGGLSGRPLQMRSTQTIKRLYSVLGDRIPIIAVGGIMDAASALEKIEAGARLLQIYTGFIYEGAGLIGKLGTE